MTENAGNVQPMADPGASENPGDGSDQGQRSDPRPAFDEGAFKAGFGKGAEKGRREGAAAILENLGLPGDPNEAKSVIEQMKTTQQPAASGQQEQRDHRINELAKTIKQYETKIQTMTERSEILERQADEARREKIRSAAAKHGVGQDQTDAVIAMYGDQITMNEKGELEVLSEVAGEKVSGVTSVGDFMSQILEARPWMAAPRATAGSGFSAKSTDSSAKERPVQLFDSRPLAERIRG